MLRDNAFGDNAHFVRVPIAIGSRGVEYIKRLSAYQLSPIYIKTLGIIFINYLFFSVH